MALITIGAGSSFDMSSGVILPGNVTQATSTLVEITAGSQVSDYIGQGFTYSGSALTGGMVTGDATYQNGSLIASSSGYSVPAATVYQLIQQNRLLDLYALVLSGNDTINGSGAGDVLKGFAGNDTLTGVAGGVDTVAYSGPAAQYSIIPNSQGFAVKKPDGTDELISIRNVRFADQTVSLASLVPLAPPVPLAPAEPTNVTVPGSHAQYIIVDTPSGQALIRDTVAGRGGDRTIQGLQHITFSDGNGVLDPTGNAEAVTRLYQAALNRVPDKAGLDLLTNALSSNAVTISALAASFTASPEFIARYGTPDNTGFVSQLYQNVLHRAPDAAGAQNFVNGLNSGGSRADALVSIANSAESRANLRPVAGDKNDGEAARLYQAALNRAPDSAGLSVFSTALSNGATPEQVAHGFVTSTEFANNYGSLTSPNDFVAQLYKNVLYRAPDAAGAQNFINALNAGASRESVLVGLSDSTENRVNTASLTHDSWVLLG